MPLHSLAALGSQIAFTWLAAPRVNCHCQGEGEAVSRALRDQKEVLQAALRHQSPATPCSCFGASLGFLLAGVLLGALLGAAAVLAFWNVRVAAATPVSPSAPAKNLIDDLNGERGGLEIEAAVGRPHLRLLRRGTP